MNPKLLNTNHIKHSPNIQLKTKIENETTFLVKSSTPFISAIKSINRKLEKFDKNALPSKRYQRGDYKKVKYLTIKGMGKSIEKTLSLGLTYQDKLHYKIDISTKTVEVLDEIKPKASELIVDDSDDDDNVPSEYKTRRTSSVEIKIWLKREL